MTHQRMGRKRYGSKLYVLVQNGRELIQIRSCYIPYVLVYNERGLIQILGEFNASWHKHGRNFSNGR